MGTELIPFEGRELDLATAYALAKSSSGTLARDRNARLRRSVVRSFLTFAKAPVEEIAYGDVEAWRSDMEARGLAASTMYQRVSLVSQFFEWLVAKGVVRFNPVPQGEWRAPFRPKPYSSERVKAMAPGEVVAFFAAIPTHTIAGLRLKAMCQLMLTTGMRAAEVCGILWRNVSLGNGQPMVRTRVKGGAWVSFELTEEAVQAIRDYLAAAARDPRPDDGLFAPVTQRRKGGKEGQPLDPFYLWAQVKKVGKRAGLGWVNVHTWRHSFAQLYHEAGASLPEVQGALGHSSGATTKVYIDHLAPRSARAGRAVQAAIEGMPN